MTDYFSRESVIEFIRSYRCSTDVAIHMEQHLNEIPAADVREVARAEFVRCGDGKSVPFMCTHCGKTVPANLVEIWGANFCPNCGADMRPTSMPGVNGEES